MHPEGTGVGDDGGGEDGDDGDGEDGDGDDGDGETGVLSSPKKVIAILAWPDIGRACPTPARLIAWTGGWAEVSPYQVRVQPDCGVSVLTGVWLTPSTLVHCLISSPKLL